MSKYPDIISISSIFNTNHRPSFFDYQIMIRGATETKKKLSDIRSFIRKAMQPYTQSDTSKTDALKELISYGQTQFEQRQENPEEYHISFETIRNKIDQVMQNVDRRAPAYDNLVTAIFNQL